jgi:2-iminobutanoate/2-iminopropanoate deaminase
MENHQLCMQALGGNLDDIVRTRVSITDPRLVEAFDEEYAAFFSPPFPARTLVVTGLPQEGMVLEVEAIAALGASENSVSLVGPAA